MNTQQNSILSVIQMRDNGCVVNDVAKVHGGKQMMLTPGGVQLIFIIKNGIPYLEHFYPTAKKMEHITREEFMTSRNTWDPTKLDSPGGESDRMISQFSPIPIDIIDSFYNDQGDIRATKNDSSVDSKVYPIVVESEVGPVVVGNNERYHPKPNGKEYQAKPKKKEKESTAMEEQQ